MRRHSAPCGRAAITLTILLATMVQFVACAPSASLSARPSPSASPSPAVMPSTTASTPGGASPGRASPDLAGARVSLAVVAVGLASPLFVTTAGDGSGRLFVAEQGGTIRIVRDGAIDPVPFLDISRRISSGGERGLLGLAFQPGYGASSDPLIFVDYTDPNGDTVVSSFGRSRASADAADPATERIRLTIAQPFPNHNGGWIGFDPGGRLVIALGDGGSGGDPDNRASRLDTLLGKLLRIDVLGAAAGQPYAVPSDNPFVGRHGALPEILHYGLRNPFRASFDASTGDLWIGDVGQSEWEEVDVARSGRTGLDFGWRRWEGRHCYDPAAGCDPAGVTAPVAEYSHADGCAVIGGVVYRGSAIPALRGAYLFADSCSGSLWAIDAARDTVQVPVLIASTGLSITSMGPDARGEVLLTDLGGALLRLAPAG